MTRFAYVGAAFVFGLSLAGCPQNTNQDPNTGPNTNAGGENTAPGDVSNAALSYNGSTTGSVLLLSSTDGNAESSRRKFGLVSQGIAMTGWLEDLDGNRLLDQGGEPYPEFSIGPNSEFAIADLPVGVDFVLAVDLDGDGSADLRTIINIPQSPGSEGGTLDDAKIDPLSTLCAAKVVALLAEHGIRPEDLGVSPSGLIGRIRDAYEHLFEDAGIEDQITADDLLAVAKEVVADLFEEYIPDLAQRGMHMFRGNLTLAAAADVEAVVKAAAQILLRGGFMIEDSPDGVDLSFLAGLPGVETVDPSTLGPPPPPPGDSALEPPPPPGPPPPPRPGVIYRSTISEPDRNFVNADHEPEDHRGPMFSEHVLRQMAELYLADATITLGDLYSIMVDVQTGLATRLIYWRNMGPDMPPAQVFQTADGAGIALNTTDLFQRIQDLGIVDGGPEAFEQRKADLRKLLYDFLLPTVPPPFEELFAGILRERVPSVDDLAREIRDARAHLPFSRTGPSQVFVLATADRFRDQTAAAVTVDAQFAEDGHVVSVVFNSAGEGKWYVGFGPPQEGGGMLVSLINRQNGRPLHEKRGRMVELDPADAAIFAPVNSQPFVDAFSESGVLFPGEPLTVPNPDFNPALPPDPHTNPPSRQMFVLVDKQGPEGSPVRCNYAEGVVTIAPDGRYYFMFTERTQAESLFALIAETGEMLTSDPNDPGSRVLVGPANLAAGQENALTPQQFHHVFGIDVPNPSYDPTAAPYFDDIDNDGVKDADEPVFDFRDFLFNPNDWRSTRIETYYRRADNNQSPHIPDVDFGADSPRMRDGTPLVRRNLKPTLNAFRFGRPGVSIDMIAAFAPPEFFDGTQALSTDTRINPFTALALVNLVMTSVHNVPGIVDIDGPGPAPEHAELIDARMFVPPVGDPLQLILDGFRLRVEAPPTPVDPGRRVPGYLPTR